MGPARGGAGPASPARQARRDQRRDRQRHGAWRLASVPRRRWRLRQRAGGLSGQRNGLCRLAGKARRPAGAARRRCARDLRRARGAAGRAACRPHHPRDQSEHARASRPVSVLLPGSIPQLLRPPHLRRLASADRRGRPRARQPRRAATRAPARPAAGAAAEVSAGRAWTAGGDRGRPGSDLRGAGRLGGSAGRGVAPRRCRRGAASATAQERSPSEAEAGTRTAPGGREGPGRRRPLQRRPRPGSSSADARAITSGACSSRRSSIPTRAGS